MSRVPLGHLRRLSPRDAWANEALDFTPWLSEEAHFQALADTLHFTDAEVEATEQSIGAFSADIIARDRDGLILIENQLEQTDHGHLGQVLTYLAGLDEPAKVVWISTKVREEHRAAIDWLNANTPSDYAFFAVELEVFQIGDGPAAPHFHVAARPNEWSRHVSARTREAADSPKTEAQRFYFGYWSAFAEYLAEHDPSYANHTPAKGQWWGFGIGRAGFNISMLASMRDKWVGAELWIQNDPDKHIFDHLAKEREAIEADFGEPLIWERLDGGKGSRIAIRWQGADPMDETKWPEFHHWYFDKMAALRRTFTGRLRALDLEAVAKPASAETSPDPE